VILQGFLQGFTFLCTRFAYLCHFYYSILG